ncbi:DUF2306 domain-containing protein [Nonomuraea spiralis]|uniref:DUF2306 domain-containing protein n=1 Tax=Nonomuraea spiralis TaxID=46182 RepID=A0ABV5IT27_9ACTN|nr:DUF2306 domain-containing protein [Nonomuraea spiralis]GGT16612.1 hypothetical protein GCM10010176_071410 [Nonomuraea spiralis]
MTTTTTRRRRPALMWTLLTLLAVGIAVFAVQPYLTGDTSLSKIPLNTDVALHYLSIVIHALPGGLALIIGPFQFSTRLRARHPKAHRIAGRVYMISIVLATAAALFAATVSTSGLPAQIAFYLLAAAWLYSLCQGYRAIRRGNVREHRVWMVRNYALTFAAVSLRLFLVIGLLAQQAYPTLSFDDVYTTSAWASVLVNSVAAEYFIVHRLLVHRDRRPASSGRRGDAALTAQ